MIFRRIPPVAPLRDIVESVWIQDSGSTGGPRTPGHVVPTGTVEILFHYGERFAHVTENGVERVPRSYVTGQRSRPVVTLPPQRFGIVIASLFPWGMGALFPGCCELADGYTDLALLVGRGPVSDLEDRLHSAGDVETRIRLVESFLLERRIDRPLDPRWIAAARFLAADRGPRPVERTARGLGLSRRQLTRGFSAAIGLPPKLFSRVMRFQHVTRLCRDGRPLADIADECGYTDQAHMSHEVRRFARRTPARLDARIDPVDGVFNGDSVSSFFHTVYL